LRNDIPIYEFGGPFLRVMARYVLRVEPLASAAPEEVVATVAPSLQRYFG
jgi:hypothetical protein